MKAIVCSTKDTAGMNMFEKFIEKGFKSTDHLWEGIPVFGKDNLILVRTNSELLVYADILTDLEADEIIFASRHKSKSEEPTLTCHFPGNFGPADLGGKQGELCKASANTMRNIYLEIMKSELEYKVSLEATHHGPFISQPCCFIELGGSEKQWQDEVAANFLVDCILKGLEKKDESKTVVGIGGGHYVAKFSELEKQFAFGHILPKYAQEYLTKEMVEMMMNKTIPRASKVIIDKKGTRSQSDVQKMLEGFEIEII